MSTKIYNGLLIDYPGPISLLRNELLKMVKEEIEPLATEEFTKTLARLAFKAADLDLWEHRNDPAYQPDFDAALSGARKLMRNRLDEVLTKRVNDYAVDFEFSLVLFPLANKTLAIPFCTRKELLAILTSKPFVKEYGYWNSTDKPDNVGAREWNQRKKDWDVALPGMGIPAESGFTISLIREGFKAYPSPDSVMTLQPDMESRVKAIIDHVMQDIIQKLHPGMIESGGPVNDFIHDYMCVERAIRNGEEGVAELAAARSEILAALEKCTYGDAPAKRKVAYQ